MSMTFKIDSYDFSSLIQAASESFDPANAFSEPQFAGNSLTDGDIFVRMTTHNREWSVPVLVISDSNDNLNSTVRTINSHLKQGVTLEYKEDGATNISYFDVEAAVLEPEYRYQRNRQGVGKFLLKVWTRPLAHTGTTRLVASTLATQGFAVMPIASMGLSGDADAHLTIGINGGASNPFAGFAWSYTSGSNAIVRTAGSALVGAVVNGAPASHYALGTNAVVPTVLKHTNASDAFTLTLGGSQGALIPTAMLGQSVRVLLSYLPWAVGSNSDIGTARWNLARLGAGTSISGPAQPLPGADSPRYRILDLGVCALPDSGALQLTIDMIPTGGVATRLLASTMWHVESVDTPSAESFGMQVFDRLTADIAVATAGGSSPLAQTASYVVSRSMQSRGDRPGVKPDSFAGLFWLRALSPNGEEGRARTYSVGAKEQFQFFR